MQRLLYLLIAGGVGGLLGWLIGEIAFNPGAMAILSSEEMVTFLLWGIVVGACIGGLIGMASGLGLGTRAHALRGLYGGLAAGAFAGLVGLYIGQQIYGALGGDRGPFPLPLIARTLGWGAFGACLGLSEGIVGRSASRARQGLLGGLIGGSIGGFLFETLSPLMAPLYTLLQKSLQGSDQGVFQRAIGLVVTGAAIGLFVGLIELIARQAWVRVLLGRNEGRDYPLHRSESLIGRNETADVPLMGDLNVAPLHAKIVRQGAQFVLIDLAGGNQPHALKDGETIAISTFTLQFRMKAGAAQRAKDQARAPLPPLAPPGVCQFCGQTKDPATGLCACSTPAPAQPIGSTSAVLVGMDGPFVGQRISPSQAGLIIGREAGCSIVLPDPSISRRHARIAIEAGQMTVYDENSTNGTFVNEQRIQQQTLRPGDIVRIGPFRFRAE